MEYLSVYLIGAGLYAGIELLWRGWTHWSMLLCGGLCFTLMYVTAATALPFAIKCLLSAFAISSVEFLTGCLVNMILKWDVWDYSGYAGNILGQVCPLYSLYWLLLTIPGLFLCSLLRRLLA